MARHAPDWSCLQSRAAPFLSPAGKERELYHSQVRGPVRDQQLLVARSQLQAKEAEAAGTAAVVQVRRGRQRPCFGCVARDTALLCLPWEQIPVQTPCKAVCERRALHLSTALEHWLCE